MSNLLYHKVASIQTAFLNFKICYLSCEEWPCTNALTKIKSCMLLVAMVTVTVTCGKKTLSEIWVMW